MSSSSTLVELTRQRFSELRLDNTRHPPHTSLLITIAIEGARTGEEDDAKEPSDYKTERPGGYGSTYRYPGTSPVTPHVDYDELFRHLGSFRAKSMYEDIEENPFDLANSAQEEGTREMVSTETIEKAVKHFKYFTSGEVLCDVGLVPPMGMGIHSKDWEKYRLMSLMSIYQPILRAKWSIA